MAEELYKPLAHPAWSQTCMEGRRPPPPCVLTIAGSDSGGGSGNSGGSIPGQGGGIYE